MPASSARPDAAQPFGGTVPGDASLLEVVNVKKLIQSRCLDIEELFDSLKRTEKQEMVFQRLPFVLRRRAMSHNPFRVPKGLRLHLATEMSRSVPKCTKRLRKDSRKRLNRLEEYRNRCARNRWLETHLYNAKRFVMGSFWGFRMALRTAQKCRRRCLRYSKRHCIVHDMSYVRVVHVSGRLSDLRQAFSNVFADSSLMFADHYLSGTYRSQAFAYATTETSHRLICPVHFIWIPPRVPPLDSPQTDDVRQIWFFVHPSAVVEFCDTIRDLQHDLECTLLNDFCIFEVMGPISAFLLRAILKVDESLSTGNSLWKKLNPANIDIPPSYVMPLHVLDLNIYGNLRPSFKLGSICRQNFGSEQFLSDAVTSEERHCLCDFKSPNNFAIVNKINVPRLRRRNYSTLVAKLLNTLNVKYPDCKANGSPNGGAPPSLGVTRSVAGSTDTPEHQKRQGYNRVSVASSDTSATNDKCEDSIVHNTSPHVPIWLIRRGDALGGFDVVVPAGTIARKLWIMCNRYGALGIGLEERHMLYAENNQPMFPQDYPDTLAGQRHLRAKESEMISKYLSTPANKRPNYQLMGVDKPFSILRFGIENEMESVSTSGTDGNDPSADVVDTCNTIGSNDRSWRYQHSLCSDVWGINASYRFRSTLPEEWIPRAYLGRSDGGYTQSRHLLLACVTAGLHRIGPVLRPGSQIIRVSHVLCNKAGLFLRQLIHDCLSTPQVELSTIENNLFLACSVEVAGHGSLSPGTRLYLPSVEDMQGNSKFMTSVMHGTFHGPSSTSVGTRVHSVLSGSSTTGLKSRVAAAPRALKEPNHDNYRLRNLKELFGCAGKCKKVAPSAAADGMRWLEKHRRPPARECFGVVTSKGFSQKGSCIVHMHSFLKLLRETLYTASSINFNETSLAHFEKIRLFTWIRRIDSSDYVAGILSIMLHDDIGSCT